MPPFCSLLMANQTFAHKKDTCLPCTNTKTLTKYGTPGRKKTLTTSQEFNCTINTFGFGYNLDSKLLEDLAVEGNGYYAFIPDSSFVGTVFVNAISDLLSTAAIQVSLSLEPSKGEIIHLFGNPHSDKVRRPATFNLLRSTCLPNWLLPTCYFQLLHLTCYS